MPGSRLAAHLTVWWISRRRSRTNPIPPPSISTTISVTSCIQMMPATRPWPMPLISTSSNRIRRAMSDPALEAHEHAEHAEHAAHERDPFISRVSITIAVLAVMAAGAGSLETVEGGRAITESSEAVLAQDKATDSWNEYQADSLKRHMYDIASVTGGARTEEYAKEIAKDRDSQDKAREKALDAEKERDARLQESAMHEERHHWL